MNINYFEQTDLQNKTIIIRVDFNVPMKNGTVSDATRIIESLATIKILLKNNCKIILMSHLGRPDGKDLPELSLAPIALELSKQLGQPVTFLKDCIGAEIESACQKMTSGQIILLENLRFHPEEESNDDNFAKSLSKLGKIYINDAFGTAHRAHASTYGITKYLPSFAGCLINKEVKNLSLLFEESKHPYTLVIGGAKIDTKIEIINNFLKRADNFIFGGGIANTFLASQNKELGSSLVEKDKIPTAKSILENLQTNNKQYLLPTDFCVSTEISDQAHTENTSTVPLAPTAKILDIGTQASLDFAKLLQNSQIIVWNGPMGVYEKTPFRAGTKAVAEAITTATQNGAISILGGGDTIDALKTLGIHHSNFTHVSTGGGAMLEFLEKGTLPGLEVLLKK